MKAVLSWIHVVCLNRALFGLRSLSGSHPSFSVVEEGLTEHAEAIPLCALRSTRPVFSSGSRTPVSPYCTSAVERPPLYSSRSDRPSFSVQRGFPCSPTTPTAGGLESEATCHLWQAGNRKLPFRSYIRSALSASLGALAKRGGVRASHSLCFVSSQETLTGFGQRTAESCALTSTLRRPFTHPPVIVRVPQPTTVPVPIITHTELTIVSLWT
jgi:hypothetical protein